MLIKYFYTFHTFRLQICQIAICLFFLFDLERVFNHRHITDCVADSVAQLTGNIFRWMMPLKKILLWPLSQIYTQWAAHILCKAIWLDTKLFSPFFPGAFMVKCYSPRVWKIATNIKWFCSCSGSIMEDRETNRTTSSFMLRKTGLVQFESRVARVRVKSKFCKPGTRRSWGPVLGD